VEVSECCYKIMAAESLTISTDKSFQRLVEYLRNNGEQYGRIVRNTLFLDKTILVNLEWYNDRCVSSLRAEDKNELWPMLDRVYGVGITKYKYLLIPATEKEPAICAVVLSLMSLNCRENPARELDCGVDLQMLNWRV
jgi:hypothetical protein